MFLLSIYYLHRSRLFGLHAYSVLYSRHVVPWKINLQIWSSSISINKMTNHMYFNWILGALHFVALSNLYDQNIFIKRIDLKIYALSFYRSQNVLGWSKFFVPDQKFIYILWQSQRFSARQKGKSLFSKISFCASIKVFEEALNAVKFLAGSKYLDKHNSFLGL